MGYAELKNKAESRPIDASSGSFRVTQELPRVTRSRPKVNNMNKKNGGPTDGPTDRRTDGWTDTPSHRDARTYLKTENTRKFGNFRCDVASYTEALVRAGSAKTTQTWPRDKSESETDRTTDKRS